jgi:hypothetical protein
MTHDELIILMADALKSARGIIAEELDVELASYCTKGDDGEFDRATLDPDEEARVSEIESVLAVIDIALAAEETTL